jgi:hypothetical protein
MISSRLRDRRRPRGICSFFNGTTSLPYKLSNKPLTNTIVRSPSTVVVDGPDDNRPAARGPISFGADVFVAVLSDGIAQPFLARPGERGELIRFIDDSKRSLVFLIGQRIRTRASPSRRAVPTGACDQRREALYRRNHLPMRERDWRDPSTGRS